MTPDVEYVEVARAESERGELVLRERRPVDGGPVSLELRANGVFVMDTVEVSSERAMAQAALELVQEPRAVVLGGLGLGYTMHELLADSRVEKCAVVEIEPALVEWLRAGLVPDGPALLADERVTVVVADIVDRAWPRPARRPTTWCCSTSTTVRATSCTPPTRRCTSRRRSPTRGGSCGRVERWSCGRPRRLPSSRTSLRTVFGDVEAQPHAVRLQERDEHYWLYVARA